jgi:hypothetical protein
MEAATARPERGKGKRYPDRDYEKVKKSINNNYATTKKHDGYV